MKALYTNLFSASRTLQVLGLAVFFGLSLPGVHAQQNALDEEGMLAAVNAERTARGLDPLTWNNQLEDAALKHSADMAENNFMDHTGSDGSTPVDRIDEAGYEWRRISENVARGYTSTAAVMEGWMNSDGHRANILDPDVTELGAAMVNNFWTQNFGTPLSGEVSDDNPDSRPEEEEGGGGGGGGGDGDGDGDESENGSNQARYHRGLASYYYQYFAYAGKYFEAAAHYSLQNALANYYEAMAQENYPEAQWSYYYGMGMFTYYTYAATGDYTTANKYLYHYLAYAYYLFYMGYADYATANAIFEQLYVYAFQ